MPELPEVETIRLGLQEYLAGHVIEDIDVRLAKQIRGDTRAVIGAKVLGVRRYGKGLVIDLSNGFSITAHVKMTGQLLFRKVSKVLKVPNVPKVSLIKKVDVTSLPDKYTHVVFYFDKGGVLFYRDIRQFGWIRIVRSGEVMEMPYFKGLGLEPLRDLTLNAFEQIVNKRKTPIKILLMDQKVISGMGNIYANDALYLAGVHPKRASNSLSKDEVKKLFEAIEAVLQKGLAAGGASEWSFVNALGEAGEYQRFFQVYRRDGDTCERCGGIIERITMGGRGTFLCPACQR